MKKRILAMACCAILAMTATAATAKEPAKKQAKKTKEVAAKAAAADAKAQLKDFLTQKFPQLPITSIIDAPVKGLLEVDSNDNIFYYSPESEMFIFGAIKTKDGKDLTNDKRSSMREKRIGEVMKTLPLDKAVKIGDGKNVIIELTDPDCPYCRNASKLLKTLPDVTRYVFFVPIAHPKAIVKAEYILSSKDKAKAYEEVFDGKKDNEQLQITDQAAVQLANEHLAIGATQLGITATPTFIINGKMVVGANPAAIKEAFGIKK